MSAPYFELEAVPANQSFFQPKPFPSQAPSGDPSCYMGQHLLEPYLQADPFTDVFFTSLQASSTADFPQPASMCFNQSMCPESPSDSSDLSNSFDYSYSPPHQMLPFAPASYSSPTHMEDTSCAYRASEEYPMQPQYTPSVCYCVSCTGAECLETIKAGDFFTYPSVECTDYHPSSTVADDFLRREMNNWDMCYS